MTIDTASEAGTHEGVIIPPPGAEGFDPDVPTPEAPYGFTKDGAGWRPKKLPGAPRKAAKGPGGPGGPTGQDPPPVEALKARGKTEGPSSDRAPGTAKKPRKAEDPLPPFRAGPIASGMNRLYARVGRIVRVMDPVIGQAIIETTSKEAESEVTVGEAWEELARTNPRIRRVLLKLIAGGARGQLIMAHAPIMLAVLMKPAVLERLPLSKLLLAYVDDEDQAGDGLGAAMAGMTEADLQQATEFAQNMMAGFAQQAGRPSNGTGREP